MTRKRVSILVLGLLSIGCDYFNDDLERLIESSPGAGNDAGTEAGLGDSGAVGSIEGADFCDPAAAVPTRVSDDQFLALKTTGLQDDFSDLSSCPNGAISRALPETDAFFKVQLVAGDRYHFHVKASPGQNLAVYLLSSCDNRICQGAIDECPAGTDEHFSFVAPTAGGYFLGIDGISAGPTDAPVTFLATHPVCGNNTKEHSEVCDDGNVNPNDGCDELCRAILSNGGMEAEPNGDRYGANVVELGSTGKASIRGTLGGPCDTDFFMIRVPQGASLRATMQNAAGTACQGVAPAELRLRDNRLDVRAQADGADGGCPALDTAASGPLAAGEYFLTLRTKESVASFGYQTAIEVLPP